MEFLCSSDENILELESGDGCIAQLGTTTMHFRRLNFMVYDNKV